MTIQEMRNLNFPKSTLSARGSLLVKHNYVSPHPDDAMMHQFSDKPGTFNGLSIEDVSVASKYRYCDDLHRPDIVQRDFSRGSKLLSVAKKVGLDNFINSYSK